LGYSKIERGFLQKAPLNTYLTRRFFQYALPADFSSNMPASSNLPYLPRAEAERSEAPPTPYPYGHARKQFGLCVEFATRSRIESAGARHASPADFFNIPRPHTQEQVLCAPVPRYFQLFVAVFQKSIYTLPQAISINCTD